MTTESVTLEAAEKLVEERKRPGANVIKLFFKFESYNFLLEARAFVLGNPFQPNLMFTGKTGDYSSEAPFRCSWHSP